MRKYFSYFVSLAFTPSMLIGYYVTNNLVFLNAYGIWLTIILLMTIVIGSIHIRTIPLTNIEAIRAKAKWGTNGFTTFFIMMFLNAIGFAFTLYIHHFILAALVLIITLLGYVLKMNMIQEGKKARKILRNI